ncbi:MAG: hypothetical protein R2851_21100 [Caldilineaceae bacterium]
MGQCRGGGAHARAFVNSVIQASAETGERKTAKAWTSCRSGGERRRAKRCQMGSSVGRGSCAMTAARLLPAPAW